MNENVNQQPENAHFLTPGYTTPIADVDLPKRMYRAGYVVESSNPVFYLAAYKTDDLTSDSEEIYVNVAKFDGTDDIIIKYINSSPLAGITFQTPQSTQVSSGFVAITKEIFNAAATITTTNGIVTVTYGSKTLTIEVGKIVILHLDETRLVVGYVDQNDITLVGDKSLRNSSRLKWSSFSGKSSERPGFYTEPIVYTNMHQYVYLMGKKTINSVDYYCMNFYETMALSAAQNEVHANILKFTSAEQLSMVHVDCGPTPGVVFNNTVRGRLQVDKMPVNKLECEGEIRIETTGAGFEFTVDEETPVALRVGKMVSLSKSGNEIVVGYVDLNDIDKI
ncbi:MAG TPA: hypothetical protein VK154_10325 [Chitinophagales bacterium]|nr:hypothetical protein [Chitinophagales bacterium]